MAQMRSEDPQREIDRLIQSLYAGAVERDWDEFRAYALEQLCSWVGSCSAVWLTRSHVEVRGEFTEWPAGNAAAREAVSKLSFPMGMREIEFVPLPAELSRDAATSGLAMTYSHRGGGLTSTVLLRFSSERKQRDTGDIRRAVGHAVEAATLALRTFIQRDEWLYSLGRPSRGTAALVDAKGTIYAASRRFRDLMAEEFGGSAESPTLPMPLPEAALQEDDGNFVGGSLHFRVSQEGGLYLLHARRPLPMDELSPREQEIARALGNGKTFKSVARQFDIAVSTVANHASRIYKKLGIFRREELVELVRKPGQQNARTTH